MSDASQYQAFALRQDVADAGFDYDCQIALQDGSTLEVGQRLLEGDGTIVTSDQREVDSLNAYAAVKSVKVPDNFQPPAEDEAASEPTLADLKKRAGELDIDGRSAMDKAQLTEAIAAAEDEAASDGGDGGSSDDNGSED